VTAMSFLRRLSGLAAASFLRRGITRFTFRLPGKRPSKRIWFALSATVLLVPLSIGGWVLALRATGNVHAIEPSVLYRSAQLSAFELDALVTELGIRTVINLRGANPQAQWYVEEIDEASRRGVSHIDIRMSAREAPTTSTLRQLADAMRSAPKPILIHCKDGADRTGLAAALYELIIAHRSVVVAEHQLSFRYGHFPWLGSQTVAMDKTFDDIVAHVDELSPSEP